MTNIITLNFPQADRLGKELFLNFSAAPGQEVLTFEELRSSLSLTGLELNALIDAGLPYVSLGDKKVFLVSSVKIYFGRIEKTKKPSH